MFQSLGRDSGRSDAERTTGPPSHGLFQSLGRDSGRSDMSYSEIKDLAREVSIARARFGSL